MQIFRFNFLVILIIFQTNIYAETSHSDLLVHFLQVADSPFSGGIGTENDPFLISTFDDLVFLSENDNYIDGEYYFLQTNDIDASASVNLNNGEGFKPIGFDGTYFVGAYDGGGHIIDNLYINRPNDSFGFFGSIIGLYAQMQVVVSNLGLTNVDFTGYRVSPFTFQIVFSGINNSFATGTINAIYLGSGFANNVRQYSAVENVYSSVDVTANNKASGLFDFVINTNNVKNAYAFGNLNGLNTFGLASVISSSNTSNMYYNSDVFSGSDMSGSGLTSVEMQDENNFANWNFEDVWFINEDQNNGFPQLRVFAELTDIYDFVYDDGNWLPTEPTENEAENSSLYLGVDNFTITDDFTVGELNISESTTVYLEAVLNLNSALNIKGELIFSSNENHIGQIGELPDGVEISGEVTVERYIPVNRSFRFVTSGVNSTNSIHENWQENGESPIGFGTHITGSDTGNNGFDITATGNQSMFGFDNSNQSWFAIANTDQDHLEAGQAYRLYIRGDRNVDLTDNESESVTILRAKGNLETGNITFDNLGENAGDFNLIGNPYQAIVDLSEVNFTNINPSFGWVWDPNMNQDGAYVVVDLNDGSNTGSSTANEFLQPGQSLFLQTLNDGAASVMFTESSKNVDEMNNTVFSENQSSSLNLKLFKTETLADNGREIDALQINFNPNSNDNVDYNDATKLGNPGENLARQQASHFLSLENRSLPSDETNLDLAIYNFQNQNYTLVLETENLENYKVYLNDRYTGESLILDENSNLAQFDFNIDATIPESTDLNRFYLTFENTTLSVDDQSLAFELKIYPNPVKDDKFTIKSIKENSGEAEVKIFNLQGQNVFSETSNFESGKIQIQTEGFSSGVYFVEIKQNNRSFKEKLIVE
ncbi:T9SS type A sorting domain-containing protein [Psychroflexus aestuariivivens]|uniref:T9SS type A sorting domain-containing protein n=1 Tax=Psychroflexus aestuariivivens TaxID=1795040 RepID=UPI000FDA4E3E|nr:T9SS type A sorting domain-containing protein [Psychroflexus aestuariivivens]